MSLRNTQRAAVILLLLLPFALFGEISEGEKNYLALRDFYLNWHDGLFGSRNARRRELHAFCIELIGQEIETEAGFVLLSVERTDGRLIESIFGVPEPSWLRIHGPFDKTSLGRAAGGNPPLYDLRRPDGRLLKIKGNVRKFKLDTRTSAYSVDLWLERIFVY